MKKYPSWNMQERTALGLAVLGFIYGALKLWIVHRPGAALLLGFFGLVWATWLASRKLFEGRSPLRQILRILAGLLV